MARKRKTTPISVPLERRTLVVWAALIVAMTTVSGLLMVLEPHPLAPSLGPVLTVLENGPGGADALFATRPAPDPKRWQAVVIHHSGSSFGSAQSIAQQHQAAGFGGLGYHFVIGNGDGAGDGEVQIGYRWTQQLQGANQLDSKSEGWINEHAISICLVGNGDQTAPTRAQMEQLVQLVTAIQRKMGIPADRVYLQSNLTRATSPGVLFPATWFRQQLLDVNPAISSVR